MANRAHTVMVAHGVGDCRKVGVYCLAFQWVSCSALLLLLLLLFSAAAAAAVFCCYCCCCFLLLLPPRLIHHLWCVISRRRVRVGRLATTFTCSSRRQGRRPLGTPATLPLQPVPAPDAAVLLLALPELHHPDALRHLLAVARRLDSLSPAQLDGLGEFLGELLRRLRRVLPPLASRLPRRLPRRLRGLVLSRLYLGLLHSSSVVRPPFGSRHHTRV